MSKPCGHTYVSVRDCKDCRIAELEAELAALREAAGELVSGRMYHEGHAGYAFAPINDFEAVADLLQEKGE